MGTSGINCGRHTCTFVRWAHLIPFQEVTRTPPPGAFEPLREPKNLFPTFVCAFPQRCGDRIQDFWLNLFGRLDNIVVFHILGELWDFAPFVFQVAVGYVHENEAVGFILCGVLIEHM